MLRLVETLKRDAEAAVASRKKMQVARQRLCEPMLTSISVEMDSGGDFAWPVTDVAPTLQTWLRDRPDAKECFEAAAARYPRSQWHVVIGFDEFDPSTNLMGAHRKKLMNVHFTFLELGPRALVNEDMWVTLASTATWLFAVYRSLINGSRKLHIMQRKRLKGICTSLCNVNSRACMLLGPYGHARV